MAHTQSKAIIPVNGAIAKDLIGAINPVAVITECITYLRIREEETTKRLYIEAKRDVLIQALRNEHEALLAYFNLRFAERKIALDHLFAGLHEGIEKKEIHVIDATLSGILGILQDNPLKDFAEFKRNMERSDFIIEL